LGQRLPQLSPVLHDPNTQWETLTVTWYGGTERKLDVTTGTALWYSTGTAPLPLRWVLTRDPEGKRDPKAYFSTDQAQSAVAIVEDFVKRWPRQVTCEERPVHLPTRCATRCPNSKEAKRSRTIFRESRRAEKWCGNERYRDVGEYGRCTKQEGLQKKEANGVPKRLCSSHQATVQILSQRSREPIDGDLKWRCSRKAGIASHALMPTETPMRPLCSGLQVIVADRLVLFCLKRAKGEGDGLCAQQMNPSTAQLTAWPIAPQDWVRSGLRRRLWRRRTFAL